jgi:acetyl/propionyl-CoA carboxylase alpha subunit
MVAKLIAHGRDRDDAIRRLRGALEDAPLLGPATNGRFLRDLLDHESFRSAAMHTTLLDEWLDKRRSNPATPAAGRGGLATCRRAVRWRSGLARE